MEKVEYIVDQFVDYTGTTRNFVMAAVSLENLALKTVSVGVSVCRPFDTFNEELGKRIALGKAKKHIEHALYASDPGMINSKVVKALLEQEAEYFKRNPGRYLAGYDANAKKFTKNSYKCQEQV